MVTVVVRNVSLFGMMYLCAKGIWSECFANCEDGPNGYDWDGMFGSIGHGMIVKEEENNNNNKGLL